MGDRGSTSSSSSSTSSISSSSSSESSISAPRAIGSSTALPFPLTSLFGHQSTIPKTNGNREKLRVKGQVTWRVFFSERPGRWLWWMFLLPWRIEMLLVCVMRLGIWRTKIVGRGRRVVWFRKFVDGAESRNTIENCQCSRDSDCMESGNAIHGWRISQCQHSNSHRTLSIAKSRRYKGDRQVPHLLSLPSCAPQCPMTTSTKSPILSMKISRTRNREYSSFAGWDIRRITIAGSPSRI